jgi:hypothetical protein
MTSNAKKDATARYAAVGTVVWNAYWRYAYQVVSHNDDGSVTCKKVAHERNDPMWADEIGRVWSHRTPLDRRDEILIPAP